MISTGMPRGDAGNARQQFDFVSCGLGVAAGRLDDFQSRVTVSTKRWLSRKTK